MDLRKLLSHNNYIIVNKELMHLIGLDETILLGELCNESIYWEERDSLDDGYFYSTLENVEKATTFKPKKQKKLLDHLVELKLINVKIKGLPAKRYIKILEDGLNKLVQNGQTSLVKTTKLEWLKRLNNVSQNDQQILINNSNNNINNKYIKETRYFMDYNDKSKIATTDSVDYSELY